VVPPSDSDLIAERVGGPVERLILEKSFHVATLDYDKAELEATAIAFAQRVTG
jgi:carboxylesterase